MINRNTNADRSTVISIVSLAAIVLAIAAIGSTGANFADPVQVENNTSVTAYEGNVTTTIYADANITNTTPFDARVKYYHKNGTVALNETVSLNEGNVADVVVNGTHGVSAGEELNVSVIANDTHDEDFSVDIIGGGAAGGGGGLGSGGLSIGAIVVLLAVGYVITRGD